MPHRQRDCAGARALKLGQQILHEVLEARQPRAALALGGEGAAATDDVVDIAATALTSASRPPCAAPQSGVRVCVWRYPGEKVAAMPEISDPAVREKLRALGYLQ